MVRSAQDKCPNVLSEEKVVDDVRAACLAKSQLSSQLVETAIVEQAGSVILNKVNEVNLAIASTVSDRVIDEVVDSLSKTCKNLQSGEGPRKRASTGTEMGSRERGSSESSTRSERSDTVSQGDDTTSQKSDPSPLATPQLASKRKSLHGRKLRPQSVVDYADIQAALKHRTSVSRSSAENFLSDGSSTFSTDILCGSSESLDMDTVIHWGKDDNQRYRGELLMSRPQSSSFELSQKSQELSHSKHMSTGIISGLTEVDSSQSRRAVKSVTLPNYSKEKAESLDSVSELPSSCGQLQHLGKARPRRVKTRAPTRPMGRADLVEEDHDISEGVDTFFRPGSSTPTTPLISPDSENRLV
ncbi:Leucine-rich repeat-containing protein 16A [Penaeus vannamei]|uniref:Leucine-rich repeat-containing protein 16A n=1 Tax=Penaeus vannamei TaxID=6689 RepID=A0A423T234_PENVA|nr:Leucine-rich repeat-containing protein 16A [Penaeus vannamei]